MLEGILLAVIALLALLLWLRAGKEISKALKGQSRNRSGKKARCWMFWRCGAFPISRAGNIWRCGRERS